MRTYIMLALLALVVATHGAQAQGYVVVVNESNTVSALSRSEAANLFLKKSARFANGRPAVPVDLAKDAQIRDSFSRAVLGRSASAIASYWQQQIFAGKDVPPVEKPSDADVLAFVRANPNAIGYVSAGAPLGGGVKVVSIRS